MTSDSSPAPGSPQSPDARGAPGVGSATGRSPFPDAVQPACPPGTAPAGATSGATDPGTTYVVTPSGATPVGPANVGKAADAGERTDPGPSAGAATAEAESPEARAARERHEYWSNKPSPLTEAWHRLRRDFDELKEYASYNIAARIDGYKATAKRIGLYAALGVVGLFAAGAIVATAAGLIVVGIASMLTRLFGGYEWVGQLVTGVLVLGLIGLGGWIAMKKLTGSWRKQTIDKYEQRKRKQRERFGRDVRQRADEYERVRAEQERRHG